MWTQGQLEALLGAERDLRAGMYTRPPQATAADLVDLLKQAKAAGLKLQGDELRAVLAEYGNLTQRSVLAPREPLSGLENMGVWVRAAARVGLLDLAEADVSGLTAARVAELYQGIEAQFAVATAAPPKN